MHLNELAKMMRMAGDESRLRILCLIFGERKSCVSDIAGRLGMSVASASHHLRVMAREGLAVPVRDGKKICYKLPNSAFAEDLKKFVCRHKKS